MSIKSLLIDPKTGESAEVFSSAGEKNALAVVTRPLKVFTNKVAYFLNTTYGSGMNKNAAFGGTPEKIHNGIDDVLWTATDIEGGVRTTFDSTDQNHTPAGSKSVKVDNSPVDDVFQFAKGSDVNCASYTALTLWIYVDKNWGDDDDIQIYGYDTGTGLQVGDAVSLQDYFDWADYDTWHKITIPLTDMGVLASYATLDAFRVQIITKELLSPTFYLDDIQLEETGTPITYTIEPKKGTWLYVRQFTVTMADNISGLLADGTMPALSYNKLLGVNELSGGIIFQRWQDGKVTLSLTYKNLVDFIELPSLSTLMRGSDGTNTWISFAQVFHYPIILKAETGDKLQFTISDDLSGLLLFRVSAGCKEEARE